MGHPPQRNPFPTHTYLRHIFFVLSGLAILMSAIDTTIVAIAIPDLTTGLNAPLTWVGWTLTAYQLVQTVMLPVAGKLSDSFGRKRVFLACVILFTGGSLLCGLAPNIGLLVVFRVIQAVGGGGLLPSAVGIVSDQYRENRAQAIGLFTSIVPIGAIIATSALTSVFIIRLGYRLPMVLGTGTIALVLLTLSFGWSTVQIGGIAFSTFWSLASVLAVSGLGMGLVNPSSNNAGLDLAPGRAAEFTGIHTMFRLTGGVLSITAIVMVLALVPDQSEAISLAFRALAIILVLTIPVAFLIPDSARDRRVEAAHHAVAPVTVD